MKPVALDLCCGLGGWAEGLIAAGWDVVGADVLPFPTYPGHQVVQDITTIDTRKMRGKVQLVVASPPCQAYSYLAMPWSRSKDPNNSKAAKDMRRKWETEGPDNRLVNECFRIADEIGCPIVLENVKGMQPWFRPAKAHYGSFYLWGDVESVGGRIVRSGDLRFGADAVKAGRSVAKVPGISWSGSDKPGYKAEAFNGTAEKRMRDGVGVKAADPNYGTRGWFGPNGGTNVTGVKQNGSGPVWFDTGLTQHSSRSSARKAASQAIAKIPFELAYHIGKVFLP